MVAEDAGTVVALDWVPGPDCNATLQDLFDVDEAARRRLFGVYDRTRHPPLFMKTDEVTSAAVLHAADSQRVVSLMGRTGDTAAVIAHLHAQPSQQFVFLATGLFRPLHMDCQVGG
jgi:hypothetical protein